jgi:inorganic triphosphatase YgiF
MACETEIKYTVPDPALFTAVTDLAEIAGYSVEDRGIARHTDTYLDTTDRLLFHTKIVLRLREHADHTDLTFKARAESCPDTSAPIESDELYRRIEIDQRLDMTSERVISDGIPESPPLDALRARVGEVHLEPSLTVVNDRHTLILHGDGMSCFELVLDDVTFTGPRGMAHVRELEVESIDGSDAELMAVARWCTDRFSLEPAGPSKYILGMGLVGGEV